MNHIFFIAGGKRLVYRDSTLSRSIFFLLREEDNKHYFLRRVEEQNFRCGILSSFLAGDPKRKRGCSLGLCVSTKESGRTQNVSFMSLNPPLYSRSGCSLFSPCPLRRQNNGEEYSRQNTQEKSSLKNYDH